MNGYIRKIVSVILTLLFCVAIIIGAGFILSVKNVNIEYISYSDRGDGEREQCVARLNELKGENLLFLGDDDIAGCVSGDILTLESYEKVYPCTLNIVLRERVELYARSNSSGSYDMYAEDGTRMGERRQNINPADDSPNVLIAASNENLQDVIAICGMFRNNFGTIRNLVRSVTADYDEILHTSGLTFELYSGITFVISDYGEYSEQKISAVHSCYGTLSQDEKLHGAILVSGGSGNYEGIYIADWGN